MFVSRWCGLVWETLAIGFLAFFSAAVGSVLGVGGGFIFIPVSTNLLSIHPLAAVPASLSLVFSNAVSATWTRSVKHVFAPKQNLWVASFAVPLAIIGSLTGAKLGSDLFRIFFGLFLVAASLLVYLGKNLRKSHQPLEKKTRKGVVILFAGFVSSLLGVGGGIIMVPSFILWAGMRPHEAVGLSQFVTAFTAATGIVAYTVQGFAQLSYIVVAAAAGFLGGFVGSRVETGLSDSQLRTVIVVGFVLIGVWMASAPFL